MNYQQPLTQEQRKKYQKASLKQKLQHAQAIICQAFDQHPPSQTAVAWTGGKDSTLLLWLIKTVTQQQQLPLPRIMLIDEGDMFAEIQEFANSLAKKWRFQFSIARNHDVLQQVQQLNDQVEVAKLNQTNQQALQELGFNQPCFKFQPESLVGNHLMKTVAANLWLTANQVQALFTGIRWDEQPARAEDNFFRIIAQPAHTRVQPLLFFNEAEVWQITHQQQIPYVSLYEQGYRSLGAQSTTKKTSDQPAWEQDLKQTTERAGRQQDKEKIMARLRDLGYM
ncbi:MAG: phosphoadenosine phosphosulfate reductase family protein [Candidatus Pacebacteria bacterium]|nr:phosphoadenosine phosphosulfate reductase family protein [Candidatus Paceibacterota bacterium]